MQLNGGITHLEWAELESQVPGRPGEKDREEVGRVSHPGSSCPALSCCRMGSMLGSGNEGRGGWRLSGGETQIAAVLPGLEAVKRASEPATVAIAAPHLLMRSSFSSLSISSSMAACRSPMRLNASFRSACRLWLAASRLSRSIS